jgi:hypothetical protein
MGKKNSAYFRIWVPNKKSNFFIWIIDTSTLYFLKINFFIVSGDLWLFGLAKCLVFITGGEWGDHLLPRPAEHLAQGGAGWEARLQGSGRTFIITRLLYSYPSESSIRWDQLLIRMRRRSVGTDSASTCCRLGTHVGFYHWAPKRRGDGEGFDCDGECMYVQIYMKIKKKTGTLPQTLSHSL